MIDRETIMTWLKKCGNGGCSSRCPYDDLGPDKCYETLMTDALELLKQLKEQEPVKPVVNVDEWVCGCCGLSVEQQRMIHPGAIFHDFFEYCPHCGKKVDWEAVKQDD